MVWSDSSRFNQQSMNRVNFRSNLNSLTRLGRVTRLRKPEDDDEEGFDGGRLSIRLDNFTPTFLRPTPATLLSCYTKLRFVSGHFEVASLGACGLRIIVDNFTHNFLRATPLHPLSFLLRSLHFWRQCLLMFQ